MTAVLEDTQPLNLITNPRSRAAIYERANALHILGLQAERRSAAAVVATQILAQHRRYAYARRNITKLLRIGVDRVRAASISEEELRLVLWDRELRLAWSRLERSRLEHDERVAGLRVRLADLRTGGTR